MGLQWEGWVGREREKGVREGKGLRGGAVGEREREGQGEKDRKEERGCGGRSGSRKDGRMEGS